MIFSLVIIRKINHGIRTTAGTAGRMVGTTSTTTAPSGAAGMAATGGKNGATVNKFRTGRA
jgi:hypothetical protein